MVDFFENIEHWTGKGIDAERTRTLAILDEMEKEKEWDYMDYKRCISEVRRRLEECQ